MSLKKEGAYCNVRKYNTTYFTRFIYKVMYKSNEYKQELCTGGHMLNIV